MTYSKTGVAYAVWCGVIIAECVLYADSIGHCIFTVIPAATFHGASAASFAYGFVGVWSSWAVHVTSTRDELRATLRSKDRASLGKLARPDAGSTER